MEHDATLAFVARQLAFLQANMLKEQQRLECIVGEKTRALDALALENERLRKQNKAKYYKKDCKRFQNIDKDLKDCKRF